MWCSAGIPPRHHDECDTMKMMFNIDENGIANIEVHVKGTDKILKHKLSVASQVGRMSAQEIKKRGISMSKYFPNRPVCLSFINTFSSWDKTSLGVL